MEFMVLKSNDIYASHLFTFSKIEQRWMASAKYSRQHIPKTGSGLFNGYLLNNNGIRFG
jgi:hypothetical protein